MKKVETQTLYIQRISFPPSEVDFLDKLSMSVSTQNQDFPGRSNDEAKNQYR